MASAFFSSSAHFRDKKLNQIFSSAKCVKFVNFWVVKTTWRWFGQYFAQLSKKKISINDDDSDSDVPRDVFVSWTSFFSFSKFYCKQFSISTSDPISLKLAQRRNDEFWNVSKISEVFGEKNKWRPKKVFVKTIIFLKIAVFKRWREMVFRHLARNSVLRQFLPFLWWLLLPAPPTAEGIATAMPNFREEIR